MRYEKHSGEVENVPKLIVKLVPAVREEMRGEVSPVSDEVLQVTESAVLKLESG